MADLRGRFIVQIPASVRILSVEPMLEEIFIAPALSDPRHEDMSGINWVIAEPETGPGARPCPPGAIFNLYEQCKAAGVPFFDKRENYIVREYPWQIMHSRGG